MNAGPLTTLLRVRELLEQRQLAARAEAKRLSDAAGERAERARRASAHHAMERASAGMSGLRAHRGAALALEEGREVAEAAARTAGRELRIADRRVTDAAVARRSTERLLERRAGSAAIVAARRAQRKLDEVALATWRRAR